MSFKEPRLEGTGLQSRGGEEEEWRGKKRRRVGFIVRGVSRSFVAPIAPPAAPLFYEQHKQRPPCTSPRSGLSSSSSPVPCCLNSDGSFSASSRTPRSLRKLGSLAAKLFFKSVLVAPSPPLRSLRSLLTEGGVAQVGENYDNYDLLLALPPPAGGGARDPTCVMECRSFARTCGPWK